MDQIRLTWQDRFEDADPPDTATVERFLEDLPVAAVMMAIDITATKFTRTEPAGEDGLQRYFFGVCHNMIRGRADDERERGC